VPTDDHLRHRGPVIDVALSDQIEVVRDCFDDCYMRALAARSSWSYAVVDDISAGQMVLLQAAALGRAVVITRTLPPSTTQPTKRMRC